MKKNDSDSEEQKFNLNIKKQNGKESKYNKYIVDDSDKNKSDEDIETKMNRLIKIKKAGKKKDTNTKDTEKEKLKKEAEKFKKKKEENKVQKEKDKVKQIENGLSSFEKSLKNIYKKRFFLKFKKKIHSKENIKKGLENISIIQKNLILKKRKIGNYK